MSCKLLVRGQREQITRRKRRNPVGDYALLSEQVFKRLARIPRARRPFGGRCGTGRGRRRRRIFFNRGAKFIECAVVALVLARNAIGNRLHALEARSGIEIRALLAAVQFERATRALSLRVESCQQHGAAIRAAGACDGADHSRRARTNLFLAPIAFGRAFFCFLGLFGAHVAPLPILPLQGYLRGDAHIIL